MKKVLCILTALIITITASALTGCGSGNANNTETKAAETTSETVKRSSEKGQGEIKAYLDKFLEGNNDFYGAWKIENFDYMRILFRNDNLAEMVTGTEGYFSKCTIDTKKKTVTVQLMPGVIDGKYDYEFSKNKNKLTLTLDGKSMVLIRQKEFTLLPDAPKKPVIDKEILGWWENEDGLFYCFQEDGVMYENSVSMETCYTYTVNNGKITAVYLSGGEMTDEFTYSSKNGELVINGVKCVRKKMD